MILRLSFTKSYNRQNPLNIICNSVLSVYIPVMSLHKSNIIKNRYKLTNNNKTNIFTKKFMYTQQFLYADILQEFYQYKMFTIFL